MRFGIGWCEFACPDKELFGFLRLTSPRVQLRTEENYLNAIGMARCQGGVPFHDGLDASLSEQRRNTRKFSLRPGARCMQLVRIDGPYP